MKRIFIQVDLKQAETRFVAYDACDENLISALEDPKRDIHSETARQIIAELNVDVSQVSPEEFKKKWRQLGKKSGHGANYAMQETTFVESCLREMDLVLTKPEAGKILEAYHKLFPGIRRWHKQIRDTIYSKRCLINPIGRMRYFYGRMDDNTFREGYAWRPQSTIPDVTNHLMLALEAARLEGRFSFWFHNQVHDSLVLSCEKSELDRISKFCLDTKVWHPELVLPAGRLVIPTSVEWGSSLGELSEYKLD